MFFTSVDRELDHRSSGRIGGEGSPCDPVLVLTPSHYENDRVHESGMAW